MPLYPKFPFIKVPGTFVSIRLEDLLMVFAALLVLLGWRKNILGFFKLKITRAIVLYFIIGAGSLFSAALVTKTVVPHIGILHWLRRVEYFVPFFLGIMVIKKDRSNIDFYFK